MTIECSIRFGWVAEGEFKYGASGEFSVPQWIGRARFINLLLDSMSEMLMQMEEHATSDDLRGVNEKTLDICITRSGRCAQYHLSYKRDDDAAQAVDSICDWVAGPSVKDVIT